MKDSPEKATILVVEDEVILGEYVNAFLSDLGYDVLPLAISGEQAIQSADQYEPDLILMDIVLQGEVDGIEAVEKIKAGRDIPVIYLTAHCSEEAMARIKQTKPHGFVTKPFQEQELIAAVEIALYKASAEAGLKESQRRYRSLLDISTLGFLSVNRDGMIEDINERLVQILRADGIKGGGVENILSSQPLIDAGLSEKLGVCLETGKSMTSDCRFKLMNGESKRLRCLFQPVLDETGSVAGGQVIVEESDEPVEVLSEENHWAVQIGYSRQLQEIEDDCERLLEKVSVYAEIARRSADDTTLVRDSMEKILLAVREAAGLKRNLHSLIKSVEETLE